MKKTAASKRASLPRAAEYTKAFLKDGQRLTHYGRHDMVRLKETMLPLIANDTLLGPEWLDHILKGDWVDYRECHCGGDFLLILQAEGHLQAPQKKFMEIFMTDTLASHRYAWHGSRIQERLEGRRSRAAGWAIARRKHD